MFSNAGSPGLAVIDYVLPQRTSFLKSAFVSTLVVTIIATAIFIIRPDIDREVTNMLRDESGLIPVASPLVADIRLLFRWAVFVFYAAVGSIWLVSLANRAAIFRIYPAEWFYVILCALLGPLLLVDVVLKKAIGRPRPRMVAEFSEGIPYGLNMDFIAVFRPGGLCPANCSFVSGEVAAAAMMIAPLMFVSKKYRRSIAAALLFCWALSGYVRFRAMAHFPSDVLFAGLYMILLAAIIHWLMFSVLRWQKLYVRTV